MNPRVEVLPDEDAAASRCAERIVEAARSAIQARGRFLMALTGGSTPLKTYAALGDRHRSQFGGAPVHLFVGDERRVPLDDVRSNFGAAMRAGLAKLDLPPTSLHPMPVPPLASDAVDEAQEDNAARAYERELRSLAPDGLDLVLLGMGDDGHVASLFPGAIESLPRGRWVLAAKAPPTSPVERRLTLSFEAIAASREVLFLVTGHRKAAVVDDVLHGRGHHPASRVRARESVTWILDAPASRPTAS